MPCLVALVGWVFVLMGAATLLVGAVVFLVRAKQARVAVPPRDVNMSLRGSVRSVRVLIPQVVQANSDHGEGG